MREFPQSIVNLYKLYNIVMWFDHRKEDLQQHQMWNRRSMCYN